MTIDDPRIQQGWIASTSGTPQDLARARAWSDARPDFSQWTVDWFSVECAPWVVADDFDPVRGTGSAFLFRTRGSAEKFGAREAVVACGARPIDPVYYADVSGPHVPEAPGQRHPVRMHRVSESLEGARGAGYPDDSGVLYAPATDAGAEALLRALQRVDEVRAWARVQELRLVEEAKGAGA